MPKIHSETEVQIVLTITGNAARGQAFLHPVKTVEEIEARKFRLQDDLNSLIKRHVSIHSPGEYNVDEIRRRLYVCPHCQAPWTEKSDTFNGGCCDADLENDARENGAVVGAVR